MFAGIELTDQLKVAVRKIPNAEIVVNVKDASKATHVIAASKDLEKMKRTAKLMAALCSSKCKYVLGVEWVEDSGKNSRRMDESNYTLDNKKYDKIRAASEELYQFEYNTLTNVRKGNASNGTSVFTDYHIYFCDGVIGNKFPKLNEVRQIVSCGQGKILSSLGTMKVDNLIVVTSDEDEEKGRFEAQKEYVRNNADKSIRLERGVKLDDAENFLILTNKEFLMACMTQEL